MGVRGRVMGGGGSGMARGCSIPSTCKSRYIVCGESRKGFHLCHEHMPLCSGAECKKAYMSVECVCTCVLAGVLSS